MNRIWATCLFGGILAAALATLPSRQGHEVPVILMGDTFGYISPCGCTKPMTGGIKRRAAAVAALSGGVDAVVLENGGYVEGTGIQDRLKAEALAESMRHMRVDAVNLSPQEAQLGQGTLTSLRNLAGEIFLQSNLLESDTNTIPKFQSHGPFLVAALSARHAQIARLLGERSESNEDAARKLIEAAAQAGQVPVALLADDRNEAERLAKAVPGMKLIQFRSTGKPLDGPTVIGETWVVSPGEHAKYVLRLLFRDGKFVAYTPVQLGPEYKDDPTVTRVYNRYLKAVEDAGLLEKVPRKPSPRFAGTAGCYSCHAEPTKVWKESDHAHAQRTLINEGHGRDPECVGCHVVGLNKTGGFRSVQSTPQLANVGCESCHGPGQAHVQSKGKVKLGKVGRASCAPCHTLPNSPEFEFKSYWKKIAH